MFLRILKLFLLCIGIPLMAQNGEEIFPFMNIPTSARQAGLGGYLTSVYDKDPNLALWNPSLMNQEMSMQVGLNYTLYLTDIKYGNLSFVYALKENQFLSFGGRFLDYGTFKGYDEAANPTGDFNAKDASFTLGYAYEINEFFTIGTNVSYVNSKIESYTSNAILTDIAATFHDYDYYNNVSLTFRNIGFILNPYDVVEEKLPFQINVGYSWKPDNVPFELTLTAHDLQEWNLANPINAVNGEETKFGKELLNHFSMGAELFPQKGFNLRLGYNFKRGSELAVQDARSLAGLTFGFGLRISSFKVDFAHARYHNSSNVTSFGLRIDLDDLTQGRYSY